MYQVLKYPGFFFIMQSVFQINNWSSNVIIVYTMIVSPKMHIVVEPKNAQCNPGLNPLENRLRKVWTVKKIFFTRI